MGTSLRLPAAAVLSLTLALGCASCGKKSEPPGPLTPEARAEIDRAVSRAMEQSHSPGAILGIWTGEGESLARAYGNACVDPETPMREGLSFRIGSLTKTFTAVLVLMLADQGLLSLEDTVSDFVQRVPDGDRITVRMLLDHTSGIFNYGADEGLNRTLAEDPQRVWGPEELVAAGVANPPYFEPGGGFMYSNTNYVLLGMIVEKVSGSTFEDELERRITGPLGLRGTYMAEGPRLQEDCACGYGYDPESGELIELSEYLDPSVVWTAGGMVSTLEDLRVWAAALGEGTLVDPRTFREATGIMREVPGSGEFYGHPLLYGMGMVDLGGWLGHDGMQPGYNTAVFYHPERKTTVVVFLNVSGLEEPALLLFMRVAGIIYPEITPWEE